MGYTSWKKNEGVWWIDRAESEKPFTRRHAQSETCIMILRLLFRGCFVFWVDGIVCVSTSSVLRLFCSDDSLEINP